MLNVYLAPRSGRAPVPPDTEAAAALAFLAHEGIMGPRTDDGDYPPGAAVAVLFNEDARQDLLPAELSFGALRVETARKPRFLPQRQPSENFRALCTVCGDDLPGHDLEPALASLGYFPTDRFSCMCGSCRTELSLREVDFGQPTAVARWWLFIEAVGTSRLNSNIVDALARLVGLPLVVVPEIPEEHLEDWSSTRHRGRV